MLAILIVIVLIVDQYTKYLALSLKDGRRISIIGDHLSLVYLENRGAAFGIFQDKKWFLLISSVLIILYLLYFYIKYKNSINNIMKIGIGLVLGGAFGNMIDRVFRGFVVDFISYRFPNGYGFPIFNVADMAVIIGSFVLIISTFAKEEKKIGENR